MSTWFYYDADGQKQGPVTGGQLKGLAKAGMITPETIVETENGKTAPARKVKGLTFNVANDASPAAPPEFDPYTFPITDQTIPLAAPLNDYAPVEMPNQFQSFGNYNEQVDNLTLRGYRNPRTLSLITIIVSVFLVAATIGMVACQFMEYNVLKKIQAGEYETEEEMSAAINRSDMIMGTVALVSLVSIVVSRVLFLFWTYRFVKNAHRISFRPLRFGPGWAVGYYFIPILGLVRPYQALSDAHRVSRNPGDWVSAPPLNLLTFWWALVLLCSFAGHAIARTPSRELEIDALITFNAWTTLTYLVIDIPLYVLTICIIWRLTACQEEAYWQVVSFPQSAMESAEYTQPVPVDELRLFPANISGWAIAAGYTGLFAVLFFPAPIALILGIIALRDCKKRSLEGKVRAVFAIIMGSIFSLLLALFFVGLFVESLS